MSFRVGDRVKLTGPDREAGAEGTIVSHETKSFYDVKITSKGTSTSKFVKVGMVYLYRESDLELL